MAENKRTGDTATPTDAERAKAAGAATDAALDKAAASWRGMGPFLKGFAGAILGVIVVAGLLAAGVWAFKDQILAAMNPFATERIDRTEPAVLVEMKELARFVGAEGTYEVIVDLEDAAKDEALPTWLVGERILYSAVGSVDAYVDFAQVGGGDVAVSEDGLTVEIDLPAPELASPNLDETAGEFIPAKKGILDRVTDFFVDDTDRTKELLVRAEEEIAAAAAESDLDQRARASTRQMLESLLKPLGYESVIITFEGEPAPAAP